MEVKTELTKTESNKLGKQVTIKKRKQCAKGTTRNRKGECVPIQAEKKDEIIMAEKLPKVEEVKTFNVREDKEIPSIATELASLSKTSNEFLRKKEQIEYAEEKKNEEKSFLYPTHNDPNFSEKIAQHREYAETKYDGEIYNIEEHANKMCDEPFELMPHQLFVKNFLSFQTPYNSLLLYHGLGSGKTCSSIGISEEMRQYMKQVGIKQRIIVIAAPNVQANFKLQLFDERRLKEVDGLWNIESCVGNTLIQEVNPTNLKGIPREKIISQVKSIINQYYVFMGYVELSNYIRKKTAAQNEGFSEEEQRKMEVQNMRKFFNNRLIIIDEVHNIRLSEDNKDDKTGKLLMKLAKYCNNMRLLLLSATPMYNSYSEIIWLTNLMNANDKRGLIAQNEVFDSKGNFKEEKKKDDIVIEEGGRDLLARKLIGYVSYVRGENPYLFPYRVYPDNFAIEKTFENPGTALESLSKAGQSLIGNGSKQIKLPKVQLNGKKIDPPLSNLPLYISEIGTYQNNVYKLIIKAMKKDVEIEKDDVLAFDELDRFGFQRLQVPIEALNIVYPSPSLDEEIKKGEISRVTYFDEGKRKNVTKASGANYVGKRGLSNIMNYVDESNSSVPRKYNYSYKPEIEKKYGKIFSSKELAKYSAKMHEICETIKKSQGIILIYSQYIDGGVVPMALALEEMGLLRYSSGDKVKSLFKIQPSQTLNVKTMEPKKGDEEFKPARYAMITGDKAFSPNNAQDIKTITSEENKDGSLVKVILISRAGSEGLDFKCIRQVHILEPWYNMNRIEQIIGRGVRQKGHCYLPFRKRNVEIYLHGTVLDNDEESADVYVYRLAKRKSEKIGQVTRLLKETSVDCLLNIGQKNFTVEKLAAKPENQNVEIKLATKKKIIFKVGDKPYTDICDYMDNCDYKCNGKTDVVTDEGKTEELYSNDFLTSNNQRIMKRIRQLYRDKTTGHHFYNLTEIIELVNATKQYPISQIYSALTTFIKNKNEYVIDKYGRKGNIVNKGEIYAFQPAEITDENITVFERKVPIDFKRPKITMEIAKDFTQQEEVEEVFVDYETVMRMIRTNLDNATKQNQITQGDQDWYKHASIVLNHLQLIHNIDYEDYTKYIIHHNIDMLMPDNKLKLISHFYSKVRSNEEYDDIERIIKSYLDENMVTYKNKSAFLIVESTNKWTLYIQSSDPSVWEQGEPEDIRNFETSKTLSSKFKKNDANYSSIIGFIDMFRNNKEMVFRIKNIAQMQNNTGTRINGQTPGKDYIIKYLNLIVHNNVLPEDPMYGLKKTKEIMQQGLCVIIEILLRHKTKSSFQKNIGFLNTEEAAYNKIAKFRKV